MRISSAVLAGIFVFFSAGAFAQQPAAEPQAPAAAPQAPAAEAPSEKAASQDQQQQAIDLTKKIFLQLASGSVDRSLFTAEMSAMLTPEAIAQLAPQLKAMGDPQAFTVAESTPMQEGTAYRMKVKFAEAEHSIDVFIDGKGLVGGYQIHP